MEGNLSGTRTVRYPPMVQWKVKEKIPDLTEVTSQLSQVRCCHRGRYARPAPAWLATCTTISVSTGALRLSAATPIAARA